MADLMTRLLVALREKPARCGYVLGAIVVVALLFTLADFFPAPYDFGH